MEKFVPCRKCKKKDGSSIPEGYFIGPKGLAKECAHHAEWRKKCQLERTLVNNGFLSDAMNYEFSKYVGEKSKLEVERLRRYCYACSQKDTKELAIKSWIYLYGDNGTQKTTLANIIGREHIRHGIDCRYVLMKTLIDNLWNSQRDDEAKKKINDWLNCDVLILDESFSKDKLHLWSSGNQLGYIDEFLRERITLGKGCIFISNTHPDDVEKQGFSHSIQDLLSRELKKQNGLMTFRDNYFDSINESEMPSLLF
jgi:hypothetical protein